ncbi:DUF2339 domain-containing protein [Desulfotomaculum sp. 1211_IL3151]|uniref:DUF2339 domain-containing protein n=1 Tax=Desulfotomaculum sp. 1211_IL3151 TaxID=3084055 RepID=UPI002FDA9AC9
MTKDKELLERIEALTSEVDRLKERVAVLEAGAGDPKQVMGQSPGNIAPDNQLKNRINVTSQRMKGTLVKEGLESLIGGKLLNRLGILILLFGLAYFLKYSFDNQWIGELGRMVIGYLAGVVFLVSGDILMRRNYRYFSQGFTGGGIGIIYLTTFAAANFYHLIGSGTAFALLILTTVAGGSLAVRQQAFGVAVLSTIAGFLAPFLIGSEEANPAALLGYVAVLDLAILYLAFYKQWRSLNQLAFVGTALVYAISQGLSNQDTNIWLNQSYLTLYFVVFGILVFLYNIRHQKPTEVRDVLLLVINAAFFFMASANNLDSRYEDWLGLFAIILALLYLMVALGLKRRMQGDDLLFLSLLGTGLAFVTIAIPLQLEEQWVTELAWTVEALALFYGGLKGKNIWVRRAAIALLVYVILVLHLDGYPYLETDPLPLVNAYSLAANLSVLGCFLIAHFLYNAKELSEQERKGVWPAAVLGAILAVKQITWEVEQALSYFTLSYSLDFSVSLAWVAFALFLMIVGLSRDLKGFRYMSLVLFGLTTFKVVFFDLSGLDMIFRILILIIVGSILVGVSFVYQRREKGGQV